MSSSWTSLNPPSLKAAQIIFWAFSPSNLCGQCSSCGSSGQRRQSVNTRRQTKLKHWQLNMRIGTTWASRGGVFVPVEIWLWLRPPSFSHETRGSQTLHLWVCAGETDQSGHKARSLTAMPLFDNIYIHINSVINIHEVQVLSRCQLQLHCPQEEICLVATRNTQRTQP